MDPQQIVFHHSIPYKVILSIAFLIEMSFITFTNVTFGLPLTPPLPPLFLFFSASQLSHWCINSSLLNMIKQFPATISHHFH